uniref:Uncharacterized protein n=1 Tax=Mola mola TaxID=94237 RepID=A0A3Q3WRY1_MOLML
MTAKLTIIKIRSLWNWGSMTCIMCFTWPVSHRSMSSSRARRRSGPLHVCRGTRDIVTEPVRKIQTPNNHLHLLSSS